MRWSIGLVAMCASASAQPALVWHAPPACPDEAALRAAIAQRLDVPVDRVELAAEIEVTATGAGFVARVTTHGEAGETRELSAASCGELTDAVAVVVARLAADAPQAAAPPPPPPPVVARAMVTVIVPIPRPTWNLGARADGFTGVGATPDLGIGGGLAAWGSFHEIGGELAIARWAATTADVGGGNGVSVGLTATTLRAGWYPTARPFRIWLAGELGTQRGEGFGFAMASAGKGRWSAAGAGASFQYALAPHLAAVAGAEALVAIDRVMFVVGGATAYHSPALALSGRLGLELRWY